VTDKCHNQSIVTRVHAPRQVATYLQKKMGSIPLDGENSLVAALEGAPDSIDAAGAYDLFNKIGVHNKELADAVYTVYDPSKAGTTTARAVVCGISLLCASQATAHEKLAFTFKVFDKDGSRDLSKPELLEFFEMLRGPVESIIEESMVNFYNTCGYADEFRSVVETLSKLSLDAHVQVSCPDRCANRHAD
jgi:Ca2+-binding EF-hand superfamily protein